MKLINKFFIGSLCLGLLTFASCTKGDDDGPAEPAYQGNFTGTLTDITAQGAESEFVATSITATHDTTAFFDEPAVIIVVENAAGVKITVNLADTAARLQPYQFSGSSSNTSTISLSATNGPYTTVRDDIPFTANGSIVITDNGMDDGILRGTINNLVWYKVVDAGPDSLRAALQEGAFEVPLTRKGLAFEPGDATIAAKIDGTPFNSTTVFSSGFSLTAANASGQSLILTLPMDASLGEHALNEDSDYVIMFMNSSGSHSSNGTINITAFDATASTAAGTFQFTATPSAGGTTVSVTEGTFTF